MYNPINVPILQAKKRNVSVIRLQLFQQQNIYEFNTYIHLCMCYKFVIDQVKKTKNINISPILLFQNLFVLVSSVVISTWNMNNNAKSLSR